MVLCREPSRRAAFLRSKKKGKKKHLVSHQLHAESISTRNGRCGHGRRAWLMASRINGLIGYRDGDRSCSPYAFDDRYPHVDCFACAYFGRSELGWFLSLSAFFVFLFSPSDWYDLQVAGSCQGNQYLGHHLPQVSFLAVPQNSSAIRLGGSCCRCSSFAYPST